MGPGLLIIGAMKAGTSSLYEDLRAMRGFAFPAGKEPDDLLTDEVLTSQGRAALASKYAQLPEGVVGVDASAQYTLRPHFGDVAQRARDVLGPDVRIVYVMRHPIARAISHHHFDVAMGWTTLGFDDGLEDNPYFIDGSRYAYQLEPWLEAFGRRRIMPVQFERYIADRQATARRIAEFVGTDPTLEQAAPDRPAHRTKGLRRQAPLATRLRASPAYQRLVRPLAPAVARRLASRLLSTPAPSRPAPPGPTALQRLREALEPDQQRLGELLGEDAPTWDLTALS